MAGYSIQAGTLVKPFSRNVGLEVSRDTIYNSLVSKRLQLCLLFAGVFFYYNSIATHGTHTDYSQQIRGSKYNRLADALLAGRLDIPVKIPPELTKDPYNFVAHHNLIFALKINDCSYYQGKLYLFHGITPALTLYVPYRILSNGLRLSDRLAVLLFC